MQALVVLLFTAILLWAKPFAKVPEASGISFDNNKKLFYVVGDEGFLYVLNTKGKVLRKHFVGKYDLEGITHKGDKLYLAVEGSDNILVLLKKDFSIVQELSIKRSFQGVKLLKKDKKNGLEAICFIHNTLFLSNQSKHPFPKEDASVVFSIKIKGAKKAVIHKVLNHGYSDIAGLAFFKGKLFMVSDEEDLLLVYEPFKQKVLQRIKLPKSAQEGITFDDKGYMYIANDEGSILRYTTKELGLNLE